MSQVNLHVSNRLDVLAAALAEATAEPLLSPFTPEIVIVQSVATRRWLNLQLAQLNGICANYQFPFLREIIENLIAETTDDEPAALRRPPVDLLTWKIESALRHCAGQQEFAAVAGYLADGDPVKRFALARRIAGLLDQYRVYRPDLLLKWASGTQQAMPANEAWQARLWLDVDGSSGFDRALARLRRVGFARAMQASVPARLSVFAPTAIAPAYLDVLMQLGRIAEVHLFLLRPTATYYGESLTPKARARLGSDQSADTAGNPLLASWGRVDVEATDLLLEAEERLEAPVRQATERFEEIEARDLLTTLQRDLFLASDESDRAVKHEVDPGDRSIALNACHSPTREVEVLYDQLLDCFESYPDLQPRDILVMTPEIEKYGPLIRAVFGYPEKDHLRIPFSIADRHSRSDSVPVDMFLTLLDLVGTRYAAPDIFLLLSSRVLRQRFGLDDEDLSIIREWIDENGIRWGIDGAHRAAQHVPGLGANTWRQGLDRLLLGFAMEGNGRDLFAGILPAEGVEGDAAETLGRFVTAVEALFAIQHDFAASRPLVAWVEPLLQFIANFFEPAEYDDAQDVRFLRGIVERLRTLAEATPPDESVEFKVVRQFLEGEVGAMEQRGSFSTGSVTFCALKPVRSIPARVICLLGLNDQVFPRRPRLAEFDLMSNRRLGDPSAGADDRFAFLETVLSARQKLCISFVGQSVQDNKTVPPSIVISELLDYLDQAFAFPGARPAREFLLVEHPLHAFSPEYFARALPSPRLFSYSEANAQASRGILGGQPVRANPFVTSALPAAPLANHDIELSDLIRFWASPCEYFIRHRLGVRLGESEQSLCADEPFDLTALEQYGIKQELLFDKLGFHAAGSPEAFAARGIFPPGAMGELRLRSIDGDVERFARTVQSHLKGQAKKVACDIRILLPEWTLSGRLNTLYGGAVLHFRCAKLKAKDQIRAWIEHLALCATDPSARRETQLIGTDAIISFQHVENAPEQLETLCRGMMQGQTRPLPFFPGSALAYAAAESEGKPDPHPLAAARKKWQGPWKAPGEKDDRYVARCFNAGDPLDENFIEIARAICLPIVSHTETEALT